ncbi:MAG TPA: amidohydrolase [Gemmatimonadaceae bacterium]|nr:amidohydrolase [Gemmatimonadaceae bacterium]
MRIAALALAVTVLGCASAKGAQAPAPSPAPSDSGQTTAAGPGALSVPNANPFPSTYKPFPSQPTVIENVTILTAAGPRIENGAVLLKDGKIAVVAKSADAPELKQAMNGASPVVIDGKGKYLTPGIIDVHSHMGVYPAPGVDANSDGNEATNPATPNVWAEHSVWPQDPQFPRALAGGVTTAQILPGSANLFGGRSVVVKMVPARTVQGMKFPGAKYGLKMACGENPKRVYGNRGGPSTRMGNVAGYRAQWIKAEEYRRKWDKWLKDRKGEPPARDLGLETLAEVLRGNIYVQNHCYRADEMAQMIDISHEFGFKIRAFHHGVEAYKIADLLAKEGIGAAVWADWGAFKMEALDAVRANLALLDKAGVHAMIHSDDASGVQRLNQEVAKAMAAGRAAGLDISEDEAVKWMTINPAWAIGLDDKIGSIETGKNADVVLWSGDPFSVYTHADKVWIDGALLFDRSDPRERWRTDFELGFVPDETPAASAVPAQSTGGNK